MTGGPTEVAVIGGGMAGLVAARTALARGAEVRLLEKGPELGGSMALSGGNCWTFEDMATVRRRVDGGDRRLQRLVVEGFDEALEWLGSQGVALEPYDNFQGTGLRFEPAALIERLEAAITEGGGAIRRSTALESLEPSDGGFRVHARDTRAEERVSLDAAAVVLATGGFQGNESLVREHVAGDARYLHRANPWSEGTGLQAATAAGGTTTATDGFYGHNVVAPPAAVTPERFMRATQYYGPLAVALDAEGRRYADEAADPAEETLALKTLERADGRAVYVIDAETYGSTYLRPVETIVEDARRFGGHVAEEPSLAALAETLGEWGFDGEGALETLTAYTEAMAADAPVDPPRSANRRPLAEPPFYAVEVQPGITFTAGGVRVDERMRVLDAEERPVPGLYTAGVDVGDIHRGGYMGGLATGLVTGRVAGREAADR